MVEKKPIPERVDRIEERLVEIRAELEELNQEVEDEDIEEPAEQSAIMAKVSDLRDEARVLEERLADLRRNGPVTES